MCMLFFNQHQPRKQEQHTYNICVCKHSTMCIMEDYYLASRGIDYIQIEGAFMMVNEGETGLSIYMLYTRSIRPLASILKLIALHCCSDGRKE